MPQTSATPAKAKRKPSGTKKAHTRARLLEAARAALSAGDGDADMAAIAREARVSVGLAYHHFGSKAGLVRAVVEDFYDRYSAVVNANFEGLSWAQREQARTRAMVAFHFDDAFAATVFGPLGRSPEVMAAESNCMAAMVELGARNIAQGQDTGELNPYMDPTLAAAFVLGGARQAVIVAVARGDGDDLDALSEDIWARIADALGVKR